MTGTQAPLKTVRRFNVDEYHRMAEAGILREDERVELLEGQIVELWPKVQDPEVLPIRRFNVNEYHRMVEVGILQPKDRVELIEGEVVEMSPIGLKHAAVVRLLRSWLSSLDKKAIIGNQDPIQLDELNQPQPDLWVAKYRADFYAEFHARPDDLFLVIEVSDSSVAKDLRLKIPLYAKAAIPEVWLVDVNRRTVSTFREPLGGEFKEVQTWKSDDVIACQSFLDHKLQLNSIFK